MKNRNETNPPSQPQSESETRKGDISSKVLKWLIFECVVVLFLFLVMTLALLFRAYFPEDYFVPVEKKLVSGDVFYGSRHTQTEQMEVGARRKILDGDVSIRDDDPFPILFEDDKTSPAEKKTAGGDGLRPLARIGKEKSGSSMRRNPEHQAKQPTESQAKQPAESQAKHPAESQAKHPAESQVAEARDENKTEPSPAGIVTTETVTEYFGDTIIETVTTTEEKDDITVKTSVITETRNGKVVKKTTTTTTTRNEQPGK